MYKKVTGVYMIQSILKPERVYIGSATIIKKRWNTHLRLLKDNKHHSPQLQRHYNKYGENDLAFEIIESGDYFNKNHLLSREQGWMIHFKNGNSWIPYFNCDELAGSRLGSKASPETRALQSKQRKGKPLGRGTKGYKYTPEQSKRRGEQQIGAKNHQYGLKWSKERRDSWLKRREELGVIYKNKNNYYGT